MPTFHVRTLFVISLLTALSGLFTLTTAARAEQHQLFSEEMCSVASGWRLLCTTDSSGNTDFRLATSSGPARTLIARVGDNESPRGPRPIADSRFELSLAEATTADIAIGVWMIPDSEVVSGTLSAAAVSRFSDPSQRVATLRASTGSSSATASSVDLGVALSRVRTQWAGWDPGSRIALRLLGSSAPSLRLCGPSTPEPIECSFNEQTTSYQTDVAGAPDELRPARGFDLPLGGELHVSASTGAVTLRFTETGEGQDVCTALTPTYRSAQQGAGSFGPQVDAAEELLRVEDFTDITGETYRVLTNTDGATAGIEATQLLTAERQLGWDLSRLASGGIRASSRGVDWTFPAGGSEPTVCTDASTGIKTRVIRNAEREIVRTRLTADDGSTYDTRVSRDPATGYVTGVAGPLVLGHAYSYSGGRLATVSSFGDSASVTWQAYANGLSAPTRVSYGTGETLDMTWTIGTLEDGADYLAISSATLTDPTGGVLQSVSFARTGSSATITTNGVTEVVDQDPVGRAVLADTTAPEFDEGIAIAHTTDEVVLLGTVSDEGQGVRNVTITSAGAGVASYSAKCDEQFGCAQSVDLSAVPLALGQALSPGTSVTVTATDSSGNVASQSVMVPTRTGPPAPAEDIAVQDVSPTAVGVSATVGWTTRSTSTPIQSSIEWRQIGGAWSSPSKDDGDGEFVVPGLSADQEFEVRVTETNPFGLSTVGDPVRLIAAASSDDSLGVSDVPEDVRGDGSTVKVRVMNKEVDGSYRPISDVAVSFMATGSLQSQSDFQTYSVLARGAVVTDADGIATIEAGFAGSDMKISVGGVTATVPAGGMLRAQDVPVDLAAVFQSQLEKDFPGSGVQYGISLANKVTRLIGICNDQREDTFQTNYSICYRLAQAAKASDAAVADNWTQPQSEDTRPNAMRHGLWNAAAAHKQSGYAWGVIKKFTTAWESDTRRSGDPFVRRQATMDIHNNTAGRGVGIRNSRYPMSKVCARLVQLSWKAQYVTFKSGQEWFATRPRKRGLVYYRKKVRAGMQGAGQTPTPLDSRPLGCEGFKLAGVPADYVWSRIVDN